MRIRPIAREDIPTLNDITLSAFAKDGLFNYLFPLQAEYPNDLPRYQAIRMRTRMVWSGTHGFVVETEKGDELWTQDRGNQIVGYAFFGRTGSDEVGEKWRKDSLFRSR